MAFSLRFLTFLIQHNIPDSGQELRSLEIMQLLEHLYVSKVHLPLLKAHIRYYASYFLTLKPLGFPLLSQHLNFLTDQRNQ